MGKITTIKYKKDKKHYKKYVITLPKETMDRFYPEKNDKLSFLGEQNGIFTFKFVRGVKWVYIKNIVKIF